MFYREWSPITYFVVWWRRWDIHCHLKANPSPHLKPCHYSSKMTCECHHLLTRRELGGFMDPQRIEVVWEREWHLWTLPRDDR